MYDDDDWDAPSTNTAPIAKSSSDGFSEGGCGFSGGRGFVPADKKLNDNKNGDWGWGTEPQNTKTNDDGWDDAPTELAQDDWHNQNSRGDRDRGGRGGGRGDRGGRGGRGGRGDRGDRGGRGDRGRGGRRNFDNDNGDGGGGRSYGSNRRNDNDNHWKNNDNNNDDNDDWGDSARGARRSFDDRGGDGDGRSGRGGRNRDFNSDQDGNNGEPEKKREIYIPPERNETEEELFSGITSGVNFIKLDDIEVNVTGNDPPPPISSFESSGLRPLLLENVIKSGYTKPTPVQKHSIPAVMAGRDLMSCAQTGSGKTAAFLLPIINQLLANQDPPAMGENCAQPAVVIISPTRELTMQIYDQAKKFSYNSFIKVVLAYGGTSVSYQRKHVLGGCHILVATPGRLKDFVGKDFVSFASVKYFVLDEADRMLDMGFLPDVEEILSHPTMPATGERITLMFSATFPTEIQELAFRFLNNYIFLAVGIVGSASTDVEQIIYQVEKFKKRDKLMEILKESPDDRTLVFVETKRSADFLATFLSENNIKTTSIHGDRFQREREQALYDFKKGMRKVLVATGVAARGLDIKDVQHVINYDLPKSIDEYVHRIGRTGRVGNRGKATSFFDASVDTNLADDLARILTQANQDVPEWLSSKSFHGSKGDAFGGRDIRGDNFGQANNYPSGVPVEDEETW